MTPLALLAGAAVTVVALWWIALAWFVIKTMRYDLYQTGELWQYSTSHQNSDLLHDFDTGMASLPRFL